MASLDNIQALTTTQAQQFRHALRMLNDGRIAEALAIGQRLACEIPHAPDAQQLLAMCEAGAGNATAAEQAFQRALAFAPDTPPVLLNYAIFLRRQGRLEAALAALQQAVQAAPRLAQAWFELGTTAHAAGQIPQATVALERAVELSPDFATAWHALGNAWRADGDYARAEGALRKTLTLAPTQAAAWINLGAVLRLSGRAADAIACFDRAQAAGYAGPELADARAGALLDLGHCSEALKQARGVVRNHPGFVSGYATLSHLLWEYGASLNETEHPLAALCGAVANQPANGALRMELVRFLMKARLPDQALEHIRALRRHADQPSLAALEADALNALGDASAAGALYAQVHRVLDGRDPAFLNAYARHLLRTGQWHLAADRAGQATRSDPANQEAWAHLGTAWRLLGDPREAWLCDYERLAILLPVEPPAGSDMPDFLAALKAALEPLHQAGREPVEQSLRGGSQTSGRLFGRPDPVIEAAQSSLLRTIQRWLSTLPIDPRHPFLSRRAASVRFCGSWSVRLWSGGRHANHIHPEGWMSSAFYVTLPPPVNSPQGREAGHLQLGQPPEELGLELSPRRTIRPESGRLALFPSYFWHGTVPFHDEQPRLTMAFDMLPLTNGK